jgi:hypothetical protein
MPFTLTDHPTRDAGRTPTMTRSTCTETVSPDVVRATLIKGATFLRRSIWRQTAESSPGLGSHSIGNAIGSRDAP